jgi:hypothetical protein
VNGEDGKFTKTEQGVIGPNIQTLRCAVAPRRGLRRFSDYFKIDKPQSQLDFVDIPLDTDIRLYVDPYALYISPVDWLRVAGNLVASYFDLLLKALKKGDEQKAMMMLSHLHEPNETRLGQSTGKPQGRGWGEKQARQLYDSLARSKAIRSGLLQDIGDLELFLPRIAEDKISDLTINVIRSELVAYTQEQCDLHGVETEEVPANVFWNPDDQRWEAHYAHLPVYGGEGLILVPKVAVRRRLVPDGEEYYRCDILPFLQAELVNSRSSLVHLLRNGDPKVYKKDLRAQDEYKFSKEFLLDFSEAHPDIWKRYKKRLPRKVEKPEADFTIESRQVQPRQVAAAGSADELKKIPAGRENAGRYHNFILGTLTQVFYPWLTRPRKEQEIDEGRKRIDISFHNSATGGFFSKLAHLHKYTVPYIPVECKNYTDDIANPEFDQMLGRLNRRRGMFGIIVCRTVVDQQAVLKRCQDAVKNDPEKVIIVLDDADISKLIELQERDDKKAISEHLEDKLREVLD